jgi:hypothetical protein
MVFSKMSLLGSDFLVILLKKELVDRLTQKDDNPF